MNVSVFSVHPAPVASGPLRRARAGGFALVVTLLIVSLLAIVAVSFLTSMGSERQTADAYMSKSRAEQSAQAGVDAAEAILAQSFRDYPDSCTVWDTNQTYNTGTPNAQEGATTVTGTTNEGTSLYLRAVANGNVADPKYTGTNSAANDPSGNNPNNPACKTFVLPLISGVPNGNAQLASSIHLTTDLTETDPSRQTDPTINTYCTDLNVRRFGKSSLNPAGDVQGIIGSPPGWADSSPLGPKPARAYWVNLKGSNGLTTGRYAFWIEDESFRSNVNTAGKTSPRTDNGPNPQTQRYPLTSGTQQPYISTPVDAVLSGLLTTFSSTSTSDAESILDTRALFPGSFFPDPLAILQSSTSTTGASTFTTPVADGLRYLTTTQSGALNLSRHGTQRLNLNATVTTVDLTQDSATATAAIQKQVDQIVKALQFHLPNFSQRFYRTSSATDSATLNATQVVYNSTLKQELIGDPNLIYFYKVAANLRDYIDGDAQPTLIQSGGAVYPIGPPPLMPFGTDSDPCPNPIWAVGKEATPFLQETAVRFRPVVPTNLPTGTKKTYTLAVDYYLEFWNMTDRDISGSDLHSPMIHISDQQTWVGYKSGTPLSADSGTPAPVSPANDLTIDASSVVFKAGAATVITTDPDYKSYTYLGPPGGSGSPNKTVTGPPNPDTTFLCPIVSGTRLYHGPLPNQNTSNPDYGVMPVFRDSSPSTPQDYHTEITFYNKYGYLDTAPYGLAEAVSAYTDTDIYVGQQGSYNDYSYGGSLFGNSQPSEMGDPRTNNEQMYFHRNSGAGTGDLTRYYNGDHTLGYQDVNYVQPGLNGSFVPGGATKSSTFYPWADYYTWSSTTAASIALTAQTAPAVISDRPMASIGQLGDVFDPARISATPENVRGGGRTFKIGQRDDRVTYDPTGNPAPNNTLDNLPASLGWASWRLADIFSAGPVDSNNPSGPVQEPIEQPGRLNINGVARDSGAALRTLLTGFQFQPSTVDSSTGISEPLFHTPSGLAGASLALQPTDSTGLVKLVAQITSRLQAKSTSANVPWGPFFERGELGELQTNGTPIFGTNVTGAFQKSTDLVGGVDMDRTFDRGREELFRRLAEMICTRGDTFTVYVVGQSILQPTASSSFKITGTQRMRVTFRLVPQSKDTNTGLYHDFHPAYNGPDGSTVINSANNYDPAHPELRFSKPDRYDVQILEVNNL